MLRILKLPTALFFDARRGNLVKTCQHILTISLFRRGAQVELCPASNCSFSEEKEQKRLPTDADASSNCRRPYSLSARLARFILFRPTAEIVESLLQAARVFGYRRVLRSGRAGPTSRGREMLTHFNYQPLPQFSVRAR